MDLPSTNWVRDQSDSTDPQASSPAVQSADGATFERQLTEIANSDGGGGAMPAASAPQPARSTPPPLYSEDASAIWGLEEALIKGGAAQHTAQNNAYSLLGFGRWLLANNKPAIVARLNDESLIADARQFIEEGHPRVVLTAIDHLRTSQSTGGNAPVKGRAEPNPHSEDVALVNEYKNEVATDTARSNAVALRSFSDYLRKNNKEGIAARLYGTSLDGDVDAYKSHPGYNRKIQAALAHLRQPRGQSEQSRGQSEQPFYSEDAALFSGLEKALINGGAAKNTAKANAYTLRSFGRWLFANNKPAIVARRNDESLITDARQFIEEGHPRAVLTAIDHLRTSQSTGGVVPIAGRTELNPYPQDAALVKEYKDEAATETGKKVEIRKDATVLRSFSHYLRENNKPGIAGRLSGRALDGDVKCYKKDAGGDRRIGAALARLRKSSAGAEAMELERHIDPEDAALRESRRVGDAAAQHSASQKVGRWPEELPAEGYDQDLGRMDEPGPSSSAPQPAQSTGIVIGQRKQPLYSEDAPLISGLEEALIMGGFSKSAAELYGGSLRSFSRWLFAEKKPSILARLDNRSLTDGGEVLEFTGQRNPKTLLQAIDYLRTLRSTGAVPISQRAKLNPPPQNVALIDPEDAVLMDPRRIDAATAQHRASETGGRARGASRGRPRSGFAFGGGGRTRPVVICRAGRAPSRSTGSRSVRSSLDLAPTPRAIPGRADGRDCQEQSAKRGGPHHP
ncbi:hypothetical protein [Bradyrhizobium sp. USDA 327]|uniref:hypothetical protein n=1 Tax=Bradyrhizobium sp. USDA 327 TaxID=3156308 RepID=UPI003515A269